MSDWIESIVKAAVEETVNELFPAEGHSKLRIPAKPGPQQAPLAGSALAKAKLRLAQKFDRNYEDR